MSLKAPAEITVFFNSDQIATQVATGTTSDTITSEGYRFTYTRDKLFTGGVGMTNPIGRTVRVPWPAGVEAQAITAGPTPGKALITIDRQDGLRFSLTAFTAKLLANTAGAGGSIEIMPLINGEDGLNDPVMFFASGYYGSQFSYDTTTPVYLGNTSVLTNYTSYKIGLYVDFALTALELEAFPPNRAPTDISIDASTVFENEPPDAYIGTLSTTDPDVGNTFSYSLVAGAGGADNGSFWISGDVLMTAAPFNYETKSNYTVRVRSEDQDGLSTQKVFQVSVADVNETPEFLGLWPADPDQMVLAWSSAPYHLYDLHVSTNLAAGFSVFQTGIPADAGMNLYTVSVSQAGAQFWKVSTVP